MLAEEVLVSKVTTIMVSDRPDRVAIRHADGFIHGKSYASHEDAMTVAWLTRDWLESEGNEVELIYNW